MIPSRLLLFKTITNNINISCVRNVRNLRNPGIDKRLKMLSTPTETLDDVHDLDDLESDFMNVNKSHKQHMHEFEAMKEQEKYHIVRQKYFKQKFPNFLTWNDKEQIRHLHRTDPEEWTVEKLSEGFPALPNIIAKLIKSNWTQKTQNKISNHDQHVQENWKLFKEGKMQELPEELKEHLKNFTNRALVFSQFSLPQDNKELVKTKPKPTCTEFSDIINDYEKLKSRNTTTESTSDETNNSTKFQTKGDKKFERNNKKENKNVSSKQQGDTYYENEGRAKITNPITLDELKSKVENRISAGRNVTEHDRMLVNELENTNIYSKPIELKLDDVQLVRAKKFNQVSCDTWSEKQCKDLSHLIYPEKISIPRKLRKRGCTYKVNDCYYDDDGTFLYRVPGMVN